MQDCTTVDLTPHVQCAQITVSHEATTTLQVIPTSTTISYCMVIYTSLGHTYTANHSYTQGHVYIAGQGYICTAGHPDKKRHIYTTGNPTSQARFMLQVTPTPEDPSTPQVTLQHRLDSKAGHAYTL